MAITVTELFAQTRTAEGNAEGNRGVRVFGVDGLARDQLHLAIGVPPPGSEWFFNNVPMTCTGYRVEDTGRPNYSVVTCFYDDFQLQYRRHTQTTRSFEKYPTYVRDPYIYQNSQTGVATVKFKWIEKILTFERWSSIFTVQVHSPFFDPLAYALIDEQISLIHGFFNAYWKYTGATIVQEGVGKFQIEHKWIGDPGFYIDRDYVQRVTDLKPDIEIIIPRYSRTVGNITTGRDDRQPFEQYLELPGKIPFQLDANGGVVGGPFFTGIDVPPPKIAIVPDPSEDAGKYNDWQLLPFISSKLIAEMRDT